MKSLLPFAVLVALQVTWVCCQRSYGNRPKVAAGSYFTWDRDEKLFESKGFPDRPKNVFVAEYIESCMKEPGCKWVCDDQGLQGTGQSAGVDEAGEPLPLDGCQCICKLHLLKGRGKVGLVGGKVN